MSSCLAPRLGAPGLAVLLCFLPLAEPAQAQSAPDAPDGPGVLARIASDLGTAVEVVATDTWDVVSFPARLDRQGVLRLGAVVAAGGLLYAHDEGITRAFRRNDGHWIHDGLRDTGDFFEPLGLMGNTNKYYLAGVLVGYASGWDPLLRISGDLLLSHWISAATYNPLRDWAGRDRPYQGLGSRSWTGGSSLPSGHASTIMQVAAVLSHHIHRRPATVVLYGLAGTVLLQRVDSESHWASDVWLGAAWGLGVSHVVLSNARRRREGGDGVTSGGRPQLEWGPWIEPTGGSLGMTLRWAPARGAAR